LRQLAFLHSSFPFIVAGECELRGRGRAALPRRRTRSSAFLPFFLESVPAVSARLKTPVTADRTFEEVVKSAQAAAVLVLVY
jgi:hypothetical protein